MPRLDHIRQFYQDGGYIKPAKRNPAEAVARVRAARQGFDAGGPALASGLLPLVRFTKNFVGKLPPVQQRALEEVTQHAKETGKESLRYGRLPGKDPVTGSAQRGVLKPIIYGDENSVALPPSYFKFLRDTQDASGQLWTAHGHPGPRSSAVPSDITGDLGVAMNRGQGSLLFDQGIKPTSGPWQNMLITSPASNTTVKLDPMNRMFTGPNARLNDALDIQRDPMLKTLLGGDNIYGVTQDDTFRRLAALKDWSGAHGIDLPGLRDWSATRSSSPPKPPREAWMPFQQSQSARMYDALGHYGVGAEMDWKTPFANTDVTQREALPSFLNYWRRFHERPGDADYGLSQSVPERQLNLGLAPGGRVGYASKGRVLRQGVDLASKAFRDWFGKSAVVDEAGAPLLAYRGEHGAIDPAQPGAQSRLGSLSFGDRDAANTYAMSPNDHRETAQAPRVMPAYLSIKKPLPAVYDYDDPFLDIQGIENLLGRSEAERISRKFEPRITNMDLWQSDLGRHFHSVDDLIKRDPSKLGQLGFDIYSYLDDPSEVARLKAAGIDGAIHGGMGETALTREYKIFDRSQGWSPWSSKPGLQDGGRVGYASKGRVIADAAQQMRRLFGYKDPAAPAIERAGGWPWRPLSDVAQETPTEIPPHVLRFGDFMRDQASKATLEGLDPRDLVKGYTTTTASIGRRALPREHLESRGLKLSSDEPLIRPEGAYADWLGSRAGQKYLKYASEGEAHPEAIADAVNRLSPYGLMNTQGKYMALAPGLMSGREGAFSEAVARAARGQGSPSEWRSLVEPLKGIDDAKAGFFGSTIGYGGAPTLDARQIILNTGQPTIASKLMLNRKGVSGEAVDRLAARQDALNMFRPPEYDPYYQHLAHHAIWDKAAGAETTHQDIIDMMQNRARGGRIGYKSRGAVIADAAKGVKKIFSGPLFSKWEADTGHSEESLIDALRSKKEGVKGDTQTMRGASDRMDPSLYSGVNVRMHDPLPSTRPTISPEEMQGGYVVGGMSDLSAAGPTLYGINSTNFRKPIWLPGGSDFPMYNSDLWAGDKSALNKMFSALGKAGWKEGDPAFFTNKTMLPQAVDQTHMAYQAAVDMLRDAGLSRSDTRAFDDMVRRATVSRKPTLEDPRRTVQAMPDWPGFKSENVDQFLADTPMSMRSALLKAMDLKQANDLGVPSSSLIRTALTDPRLAKVGQGTVGRTIGDLDMDTRIIEKPAIPHESYGANLAGNFRGGFDRPVPGSMLFRDWHNAKGFDPQNMSANNMRSFIISPTVQKIDQQFLDQFMPQFQGIKPGWKSGGRATQRDYELYHPIMWDDAESFAEGGKVAFPVQSRRRDYEQYHVLNNWEDDPGGWW